MDERMPFELFPYVGAGQVKFGMTPSEVKTILGDADQTSKNHLKQRVEFRSYMNVAYSAGENERLIHLGFGRQMTAVTYKDISIFSGQRDLVLDYFVEEDGNPYIYLGFVVLMKLGITLTGFHDNDVSQLAVTLFSKGAWDSRIPKMKPFRNSQG